MAKHKYIRCDIYKRGIYVFVGSIQEFAEWIKETFTDDDEKSFAKGTLQWIEDGNCGAASFHYSNEMGGGVILIPSLPEIPKDIASLAHECLHATFFIMDYCGVSYHQDSPNEPFTYLLEHLMRNALEEEGYEEIEKKGETHDKD